MYDRERFCNSPSFPFSPFYIAHLYFEARVEEETLKKVVWHSVATALASIVFPVPGGPNISTPCSEYNPSSSAFLNQRNLSYHLIQTNASSSQSPLSK